MRSIVIVGAGIAGLSAARELRRQGWPGDLTIVGSESHLPYRRPPLSKEYLAAPSPIDVALHQAGEIEATWMLGRTATGLKLADHRILLDDGEALAYDGLVIATGVRARELPECLRGFDGVHTLRTLEDADRLRADLNGASAVLVVGGGFLGNEVAATLRSLELHVTLVERNRVPLLRPLGQHIGALVAKLHRKNAVDLRLGHRVLALGGGRRVTHAVLDNGDTVPADVVVAAVGAAPETGWLRESGLSSRLGVLTDSAAVVAPGIVAAGDVAAAPQPLLDGLPARLEHYSNAMEQGARAARTLLGVAGNEDPTVPSFWTHLYDWRLQTVGLTGAAFEYSATSESSDNRFLGEYRHQGRVVGAITNGRAHLLLQYRERLLARLRRVAA